MTFATITISFAPHLVAMTSFLSLEKVRPIVGLRGSRGRNSDELDRADTAPRVTDPAAEPEPA
jgi:hypothetical protein